MRSLLLSLLLSSAALADHGAELVWRSGAPFAGLSFALSEELIVHPLHREIDGPWEAWLLSSWLGLGYQLLMVASDQHDFEAQDVAAYSIGAAVGSVASYAVHSLGWDSWWPGMARGRVKPWQ